VCSSDPVDPSTELTLPDADPPTTLTSLSQLPSPMTLTPPTKSPLHALHAEAGARFTDFAGWTLPLRFSGELFEHRRTRAEAGLFDLCHMAQFDVIGPKGLAALDTAVVGDMGSLAVGRARYTMLCNESGGILDDLVVYRLTSEHVRIIGNATNHDVVREALLTRVGSAARVTDAGVEWTLVALQGPAAERILAHAAPGTEAIRRFGVAPATIAGVRCWVARTGYTGEDGFEIMVGRSEVEAIWKTLLEPVDSTIAIPVGLAARDSLRLEAALPLYGNELTLELTPFDAGFGHLVRLEKPAFVGREALAARAGRPDQVRLIGLVGETSRSARHGHLLYADPQQPTRAVGHVTSGAPSPTLGHPIAMAYVEISSAVVGNLLWADVRGRLEPERIVSLPFYRRNQPKGRPS